MFTIKNILLPTDLSKTSLTAASFALDIAAQYNAKIHLLYVLEKTPPILAIRSIDISEEKIIKEIDEDAKSQMNEVLKKVKEINNNIEVTPVINKGLDYEEIINYSKNAGIDLIVIATHGRTGLLHTLLGSVAEKVIRYSKIPVLVITPTEGEK